MRPLHRVRAVALIAVLALAACQNQSSALLTDPRAILDAAVASTIGASSVRVDLSAEGELVFDPLGIGTGTPIALRDTTATADVDLAGGDSRLTFAAPGLLGLAGELLVVDGTTYLKTSLTGSRYQVMGATDPVPSGSPATASMLAGLTELLARPELTPVKGDDVPCGTGDCYTVRIQLTAEELAALGLGDVAVPGGLPIPIPDLSAASADLTLRVDQASTRLTGMTADVDLAAAGNVILEVTFTKWDEPVSVAAPPAEEIQPAS